MLPSWKNSLSLLAILSTISSSCCAIRLTPTSSPTPDEASTSPPTSESAAASCADDWHLDPDTNACYFLPKSFTPEDMKNWDDALSYCQRLPINSAGNGSWSGEAPRLVDITSEAEQKFLERTIVGLNLDSWDFWTGGHDVISEGNWDWSESNHTHSSANYTNWDDGQPAKIGKGGRWQDCLFLGHWKQFKLRWHDNPCTYKCFYICEYSLPSVVPLPSSSPSTSSGVNAAVIVVVVVLFLIAAGILLFFLLLFLAKRRQREYRTPGRPGTSHSEIFGPMTVEAEPPPVDESRRTRATTTAIPNDLVAYFRKGFGWKRLDDTDKRTLVENIVISIENDVGGRGREGGVGESEAARSNDERRNVST